MKHSDLLKNVSVLFLEEEATRRELFERWLPKLTTKAATGPEELLHEFDESVTVALLSRSCFDADEAEIRKFILHRNPSCQLILLTDSGIDDVGYEEHYDAALTRPITRETLQSTVRKRVKYGLYSSLVEEFYALNARLVGLRGNESEDHSELIPKLEARIERLETSITQLKSTIDHDDVEQLLESARLRKTYLNTPSQDADVSFASKYHPDECPNCSLSWGVYHGPQLRNGVSRIGANVWKCTDCSYVMRGPDGSHRHIT